MIFLDVIKKSIISSRVAKGSNKCFDDTCFDPKSFHRLSVDPTSKWRTSHIWKWFTNRVHEVVDKKIFELFPDNKYKRSECFRKTIRSGNLIWVKLHSEIQEKVDREIKKNKMDLRSTKEVNMKRKLAKEDLNTKMFEELSDKNWYKIFDYWSENQYFSLSNQKFDINFSPKATKTQSKINSTPMLKPRTRIFWSKEDEEKLIDLLINDTNITPTTISNLHFTNTKTPIQIKNKIRNLKKHNPKFFEERTLIDKDKILWNKENKKTIDFFKKTTKEILDKENLLSVDIISQIEESDNSIEEEETLNDLIDQFNSNDSNNDKSNESNENENIQHQIEQNFHNLHDKINTDIITPYELKRLKKIKKKSINVRKFKFEVN